MWTGASASRRSSWAFDFDLSYYDTEWEGEELYGDLAGARLVLTFPSPSNPGRGCESAGASMATVAMAVGMDQIGRDSRSWSLSSDVRSPS